MKKEEIFEKTGRLIFRFQSFDTLLDICLTFGYINSLDKNVWDEVFRDLNLQTKLKLLKKLTTRKKIDFDFSITERYQKIRNTIIHGQGFSKDMLHLQKGGKAIDIKSLFIEVEEIQTTVENNLQKLAKILGVPSTSSEDTSRDSYDFPVWGITDSK